MPERDGNNSGGDARSISSTLLGQLREQDPAAWQRLCDLCGPMVYHWCRRAGVDSDDSADLFQEVFQSVAGNIDSFRHDRPGDSFSAWLATITRNKIRDYFRRQAKTPQAGGGTDFHERIENLPDPLGNGDSSLSEADESSLIHRALQLIRAEFEERTWRAFWQTTIEERWPADVAEELGVTPSAVYTAKSRVLRRLREELDGLV
jgi:RNA polymerase sigma-70 factor (ECF subfamily)